MSLPIGKVKLVFEVYPSEKEEFAEICKFQGITKIEFLRRAIRQEANDLKFGLLALREIQKEEQR